MNNNEKYLPLGTVVMLHKGRHRAMIVGYCAKILDTPDAPYYDYIGCLFPEGIFTNESSMVFNHSDIKEIYHLGFVDEETRQFHNKLNQVMKNN